MIKIDPTPTGVQGYAEGWDRFLARKFFRQKGYAEGWDRFIVLN